jgi:acyl-CoA thioesterase
MASVIPMLCQGGRVDANELAAKVAAAMLAAEGTGPAWGLKLEEAREDFARVSMVVRDDMLNGHGIAHGGMIFALADSAFAYVCNGANHASVAAQASIVFLGKAELGETLVAEASEIAREGRAGVTRVSVKTASGRDIAEFTGYSRTIGGSVLGR